MLYFTMFPYEINLFVVYGEARISMEIYIFMGAIKEIEVKDSFYLLGIATNIPL